MSRISTPASVKIVSGYAAGAALWILLSDRVLAAAGLGATNTAQIGTLKGLLFVAVTALLLLVLLRRWSARSEGAEAALRENELRMEAALEATGDGVWDWDVERDTAVFSRRCKVIFGVDGEDAPQSFAAYRPRIHGEDLGRVEEELRRHFSGATDRVQLELRVPRRDGQWRWILVRGRVIERRADGRPLRMIGVASDITERRLEKDRAAAMQALNDAVVASSPVGIISFRADGRIASANTAAAHMLDLPIEVLLTRNLHHARDWEELGFRAAADRAITEDREVEMGVQLTTVTGRRMWLALRFAPFSHLGEQRLLLVLTDESEKQRALEDVRIIHAALQKAPVGWMIADAQGRIEWINPAFTTLTGYSAGEVIGQNPRLLKSGQHDAEFYRRLWGTILRGDVWDGELCNRRKDGSLYRERTVITPVLDEEGVIQHFVAMKHDITKERELEQQLAQAQRLESIGMLASGIAHDLNNVLSPIVLSIGLLKMKFPRPDAVKVLDVVEKSAQRGVGIVRQVLTFARGVDGERGEVSPRNLVKDVARLAEETFPVNIEVNTDFGAELPTLCGDVTQLHQVLLNLAVNARDAMPHGGTLTLRAEACEVDDLRARRLPKLKPGLHVAFTVADTGTGIAPEVLARLFEPFFTTKPRGKGTGLGLSTVHGIVRSHGGAIEVKTVLGQGSEFVVLLPRMERPAASPVPEAPIGPPLLIGAGRRVLVDDEATILDIVGRVLRHHGFEVHLASGGHDALALFDRWPAWNLALVDRLMPGIDGCALAQQLRAKRPQLSILLMSGSVPELGPEATRTDTDACGLLPTLAKPFTESALLAAVARELGRV